MNVSEQTANVGGSTFAVVRQRLRSRMRENWAQEWSWGRFDFEIEWVPKSNGYFTISLTRNDRPNEPHIERLIEMLRDLPGLLAKWREEHGICGRCNGMRGVYVPSNGGRTFVNCPSCKGSGQR